jgi:asparagine synthase (glutamine-hydrolysing)
MVMCGIAGYLGSKSLPTEAIDVCLSRMRRRGPDNAASKHWVNAEGNHVYLLHSRLKIIDLDERANQPFTIGDKTIVFNGELYNYIEVKQRLTTFEYQFRTSSDTEVLLAAICHEGWQTLDRCEGMWAFAVYDANDGSLTLSRDRFGEKPLYVFRDGTEIYFGSEPKFIFALLERQLPINLDHLIRYLVNGYRVLHKTGDTFFQGLREVPSASILRIDRHGAEVSERYWTPRYDPEPGMPFEEATAGTRARLIRSVELRLRSDVPIAFCMSGGVDSNSLISIAKRVFNYDVHGFTVMNTDHRYEEREMVNHCIETLGIRHTSIPVQSEDVIEDLQTMIRYHDSPICTISYLVHWLLMGQIAAHGYRISVSGTAADEMFSGYYDHHLAYLAEIGDDPVLYKKARDEWEQHVRPVVRNPFLSKANLFLEKPTFRDHLLLNADVFATFLDAPWYEPFTEQRYTPNLLRNRMLNEMFVETVPPILHEDDLNAMFYSIENRSPFLDRNLFEFCNAVPTRHLIRNGYAKAVLRESMRGIVPDRILDNRRKVGFNAPMFDVLDRDKPSVRNYLLDDGPIFKIVRKDKFADLMQQPSLTNSYSKFLFNLVNAKIFVEMFS